MQSSKITTIVIILVVLGVLGFGGYWFMNRSAGTSSGSDATLQDQSSSQAILTLAAQLSSVTIDSSFFTSPLFVDLKQVSAAPQPEPSGRPNPFAFIGSDGAVQSVVSTTTVATTSPVKPPVIRKK